MTKRCSVPCQLNRSQAFTLVEVLVVLVLISILSSMVLTAVNGVTNSARIARTRSIIATIDSVLQEQLETYKYRPLAVMIPDITTPTSPTMSYEVMPNEAARVRLIMIRDLMRMEMPDKVGDLRSGQFTVPPAVITAAVDRVVDVGGRIQLARANTGSLTERTSFPVTWHTLANLPAKFQGYLRRTSARVDNNPANAFRWTPQHQGAECLYLILASTYVAGTPAIDAIPSSNIADTDGDGVPEILDGWGRPLGFVRWPVGYLDGIGELQAGSPDEFDPYRADFGYTVNAVTRPFALRPLVVSAGPDGEFGIAFTPRTDTMFFSEDRELSDAALQSQEVNYAAQVWPVDTAWMGPEAGGRLAPYRFPDPYLRVEIASNANRKLPGAPLDVPSSRRDDNISNYDLESTE